MELLARLVLVLVILCVPLHARKTWEKPPTAWEEPWGADAGLTYSTPKETPKKNLLQKGSEVVIKFHQNVLSPVDGPRSHYAPSSSYYTLIAVQKYGFFKGWMMGCDRLLRENSDDWVYPIVTINGRKLKEDIP